MIPDKSWLRKKAEQEDGCFVSVGGLINTLEEKHVTDTDWDLAAEMARFLTHLWDEYKALDHHFKHSLESSDLAVLGLLVAKIRPITEND